MWSISFLLAVLLLVFHSPSVLSIQPGGGEPLILTARQSTNRSSSILSKPAAISAVAGTLRFQLVTSEAPWSARSIGAVELYTKPFTFKSAETARTVNVPANSFVLHGGSGALNDVWVSVDHGRNWQLAAGITIEGQYAADAAADTSFTSYLASAVLIDYNSNIYRIGGRERTNGQDYYYGDVWATSTTPLKWTNVAETSTALFDSERFYAGAIATSKNELILQGGTYNNFQAYKSDVWSSTNGGRTWRVQTEMAEFGTRGIGVLLQSQHNDRLAGKDILYLIGGQNEKDNNNEVWTSSDSGRTWQVLNIHSPWPQRDAFNGEITKDGVLVISSGLGDRDVGVALEAPLNDVWISLNGGYTWGQCVEDAEFEDRYLQFTMLDEAGYLYVVAGRSTENGAVRQFNDVWRSSLSFHDIDAISKACNVPVPSCGVGLRCYPNADTQVAADGSYVSCDACPHSTSVSAGVSPVVIALVVFVLLFVATAAAFVYVLRRRGGGGTAGGAATWWQKSTAGTNDALIGATDGYVRSDNGVGYAQA